MFTNTHFSRIIRQIEGTSTLLCHNVKKLSRIFWLWRYMTKIIGSFRKVQFESETEHVSQVILLQNWQSALSSHINSVIAYFLAFSLNISMIFLVRKTTTNCTIAERENLLKEFEGKWFLESEIMGLTASSQGSRIPEDRIRRCHCYSYSYLSLDSRCYRHSLTFNHSGDKTAINPK